MVVRNISLTLAAMLLPCLLCRCAASPATRPVDALGIRFVHIPAGTFMMGSPASEAGRSENERAHEVRITRGFWIATTPVTRGQFTRFVAETKYVTAGEREGWSYGAWNARTNAWDKLEGASWRNPGFGQTDEHPVVDVDWNDAVAFCRWMSQKDSWAYRLPTEAEWEYACRAGAGTAYFWGDDPAAGACRLNGLDVSGRTTFTLFEPFGFDDGFVYTSPVAHFKRNAWGIHDALGNVLQWCADWYPEDYNSRETNDPHGPPAGTERCLRGGAFVYGPARCRCAFRGRNAPTFRNFYIGFRMVREE